MYKGFIKKRVRKVICEVDIPINRALDFLKENHPYGIIEDYNGVAFTKEELEHVKDFGQDVRIEPDFAAAPVGEVSESSYRKLFGTLGDNSESGTERDS